MSRIALYSGGTIDPLAPKASEIMIADIGHSLSMMCRYGGHTDVFYSVAEHCWHMSFIVPAEDALWALLHDAPEAYLADVTRPLKRQLPDWHIYEDRIMSAVCDRFGLDPEMPATVKMADDAMIPLEWNLLMCNHPPMKITKDLPVKIRYADPRTARQMFLERFAGLRHMADLRRASKLMERRS